MTIEKEKMIINTHKVISENGNFILTSAHTQAKLKLTALQKQYLDALNKGLTFEQLVTSANSIGHVVSFRELFKLVDWMVKNNVIANHSFKNYFQDIEDSKIELSQAPIENADSSKKWNVRSILEFPFFRNLNKNTAEVFVDNATLLNVPERTLLIKNQDTTREMYVLLEGTASIYRVLEKGKRQLITPVPAGSVFGEGAFLFNRARTADVITNSPAVVAKIDYNEKDFAPLIQSSKTDALQIRFWILHGLLSSPLFHSVPSETMDRFAYAGKVREVPTDTVITQQGMKGDSFFVIIQGEVAIMQNNRLIKTLKNGDIFGEIALMVTGGTRIATAIAKRDCMLLEVTKQEFFKVLSENLVLAKEIEDVAHQRYSKST